MGADGELKDAVRLCLLCRDTASRCGGSDTLTNDDLSVVTEFPNPTPMTAMMMVRVITKRYLDCTAILR